VEDDERPFLRVQFPEGLKGHENDDPTIPRFGHRMDNLRIGRGMVVRSHYRRDSLVWSSPNQVKTAMSSGNAWYAISRDGSLQIGSESWVVTVTATMLLSKSATRPPGISFRTEMRPGDSAIGYGFWTSNYTDYQPLYSYHERLIRIGWMVILVATLLPTALLTIIFVRRLRETRRLAQMGHCQNCGYDLRATPDKCPECGTIPSK
jgi:hypothetical protein